MEKIKPALSEALLDFNALPDIFGVFVSEGGSLLASKSHVFEPEKLETMASHILRAFKKANEDGASADRIIFSYQNGMVVSRVFDSGAFLNVLCGPKVQLSSLELIIDVVVNKISKELGAKEREQSGAVDSVSAVDVLHGPLGPILKKITDTLCDHIGPAGEIVLSDALTLWCKSGQPDKANLGVFFQIIKKELDSEGGEQWFLDLEKSISSE
ncbi:MAG: hypothetical protein ACE5FU_08175 [Nitrospinota bacterium]